MDESLRAYDAGAQVVPQIAARPFGMLLGFPTRHGFSGRPTYRQLAARLDQDELLEELAKPAVRGADPGRARRRTRSDRPVRRHVPRSCRASLDRLYSLGDPPVYEPTPDRTIAAMAEAARRRPDDDALRRHARARRAHLLMLPFFNYAERNHDAIREMLLHPGGVSGLSDGGAHCGLICDASIPTFMLTHWARDRVRGETLPLEYLVKKQTSDTAALFGLGDRGVLQPGKKADVNVIDFDRLSLGMPRMANDLPAGGGRLLQDADGYVATMVSGEVTRRHGVDTGARPGRLLRGAR